MSEQIRRQAWALAVAVAGCVACTGAWAAQQLLFDNGPLVTGTGNAPDGSDTSAVQSALNQTVTGFSAAPVSRRVADDFVVPASGWVISQVELYAFQAKTSKLAPTINSLNVQIWNGVPNAPGSMVVFGDTSSNLLSSVSFAGMYRIAGSKTNDVTRPVMLIRANLPAVTLTPGTYFIDWQIGGSAASGPYVPQVTRPGQVGSGNAQQLIGAAWRPIADAGTGQSLPFHLIGDLGSTGTIFANGFE